MLTIGALRNRLKLLNQARGAALRVAAVVAGAALLFVLYDNRQGVVDLFRTPTTGVIYVDSPEIYTRERLVNDRFVQDSWLRSQLDKVNSWTPVPMTSSVSRDGASLGAPAKPGAGPPDLSAPSGLSPTAEFRIRNAVRELIRQEIVENQLDDRHDFGGNTIFMLKFDTAIIPGDRTTASAVIDIRVGPKTVYAEMQEEIVPDRLPQYIASYYQRSPFHSEMLAAFEEWVRVLNGSINERLKEFNRQFWETDELDNEFNGFMNEHAKLIEGKLPGQDVTLARPLLAKAIKEDTTPESFAQAAPHVAMFVLKKAVEEVNARAMNGVVFASVPNSPEIIMSADWPLFVHVMPSGARSIPPTARVVAKELSIGYSTPQCISKYEAEAQTVVNSVEGLRQFSFPIFSTEGLFEHRGKHYSYFLMNSDVPAGMSTDLNEFPIREIASLFAGLTEGRKESPPPLASSYIHALVNAFVASTAVLDNAKLSAFYDQLSTYFPGNDGCTVDVVPVPASYFRFLNNLMKQRPFSYAVLPKYDADFENVEAATTRQMELSSILNKMSGGAIPADLGLELLRESKVRQSRARTRLIGYGSSSDSETPSFGWVISPGASPTTPGASDVLEPQQKSLAALISVPAWWREVEVNVRTGWTDRADGRVNWAKCNLSPISDKDENPAPSSGDAAAAADTCTYLVRLPQDPLLLDDIVLRQDLRKPRIAWRTRKLEPITLQRCARAAIEIPGLRLWRSTVVTLNGQRATSIVVLPDMRGIIAEFDAIQLPEGGAKLTVWTSEGNVEHPGTFTVVDKRTDKLAACASP